jgi:hypothetical protein
MVDRRRATQLAGETIREMGLLLAVFGPLDVLFQGDQPGSPVLLIVVAVGLLFILAGIIIEARKEQLR